MKIVANYVNVVCTYEDIQAYILVQLQRIKGKTLQKGLNKFKKCMLKKSFYNVHVLSKYQLTDLKLALTLQPY